MISWASLVTQIVENPPAMHKTQVQSLEDPLEKGMAAHSRILSCRIPWTEEPGRLQSMGWQRVGYDWAANTHTHTWLYLKFKLNFWRVYVLGYKCKRFFTCKDWRAIEIVLWQFPLIANTFLGSREKVIWTLKTVWLWEERTAQQSQHRWDKRSLSSDVSRDGPPLPASPLSRVRHSIWGPLRSPGSLSPWRTKMAITHYLMLFRA